MRRWMPVAVLGALLTTGVVVGAQTDTPEALPAATPPATEAPVAAAPGADVPATAAPAADPAVAAEASRMFRTVMSPFCPGLTLADCPSGYAIELREEVEGRLVAGESTQAVLDDLVGRYGQEILADPTGTPMGNVVIAVPVAASLLAAIGVALYLRRRLRGEEAPVPAGVAIDPQVEHRLDEELAHLD